MIFSKKRILSYVSIVSIMCLPIFAPYKFIGPISIGSLIIFLSAVFVVLLTKKITINKDFATLIYIQVALSLISGFIQLNEATVKPIILTSIMIFIDSLSIMQLCRGIEKDIFEKVIRFFMIITVAFLIYQLISINLGIMPNNGKLFNNLVDGYKWSNSVTYKRVNSIFSEPSYFSIYILPIMAYFSINNKNKIAIFLMITLFLSTSSLGILGGIIILLYNIFRNYNLKKIMKILFILVFLCAISLIVLDFFNLEWIIKNNFTKLDNLQSDSAIRFMGNLDNFRYLPNIFKFIGVGTGQLATFLLQYGIVTYNYSNALIITLFNYGILGFIVFISTILKLFIRIKCNYRSLVLIFLLISMVDYFIYSANFYYITFFIMLFYNKKNIEIKF